RHTVRYSRNSGEVFLVVGARARDEARGRAEHTKNRGIERTHDRRTVGGLSWMNDHQVAHLVHDAGRILDRPFDEVGQLALGWLEAFFDEESPIEDSAAAVGNTRRLDSADRLTALYAVDVDRCVTGALGHHWHAGRAPR